MPEFILQAMLRSVQDWNSEYLETPEEEKRFQSIISSMRAIDRKHFVKHSSYADRPQQISHGQTISQPTTVARMLFLAKLKPGLSVLEVGACSGWNACLIAYLVKPGKVVSIERIPGLASLAQANSKKSIEAHRLDLEIKAESVFDQGSAWTQTYDRIIITAGIDRSEHSRLAELAMRLLADNGILICPHRTGPMIMVKKKGNQLQWQETEEEYCFVPLV